MEIADKIYLVRGVRVMLDYDLALLYQVETRVLNQAVKRNIDLFPADFMFQLSEIEWNNILSQFALVSQKQRSKVPMSSQIVMTYPDKRPRNSLPFVFTEHGVAMLSNILKSKTARKTSVEIVRAFILMRQMMHQNHDLSIRLKELESKFNRQFKDIYDALNYLIEKDKQPETSGSRKRIGYSMKKK